MFPLVNLAMYNGISLKWKGYSVILTNSGNLINYCSEKKMGSIKRLSVICVLRCGNILVSNTRRCTFK